MTFLSVSDLASFDHVFALLMLFFLRTTVVAGGGPAAAYFLCFAKESKQRKGWSTAPTQRFAAPSGFPLVPRTNREGKQTRFAQTSFPSLSDLCASPTATHKRNSFFGSLRIALGGSPSAS